MSTVALVRMPARAAGTTPLPGFLQIEPVGQCNLRCRMCPIELRPESAPGHPAAHMDFDVFRRVLAQFEGVRVLQLQGLGEPLLHPRFFDMVRHAVSHGITVSTNTNLTLLTPARAAECVDSGLAEMHLSIDGASAATYEHIRRQANFAKVMRNLRRLVDARARAGGEHLRLRWVMVVMRHNLHEVAQVVRLAADHGLPAVHVQHLCHDFGEDSLPARYRPMRDFVEDQTLLACDPARVDEAFDAARAMAAATGIELRLPEIRFHANARPVAPGMGRARCDWPWSGAYVGWDGSALPCCMVSTPDRVPLGNVATEGVSAVWNGAPFERFRERLDAADPAPAVCRSCSVWRGVF